MQFRQEFFIQKGLERSVFFIGKKKRKSEVSISTELHELQSSIELQN